MSKLVDTAVLRRWAREWVQPFSGVLMAAADELDSLRREIEGLRKEIRLGYKHDREHEAELAQLRDRHLYETDLVAWQRKTVAEMARPAPICTDIPESAFPDPNEIWMGPVITPGHITSSKWRIRFDDYGP